MALSPMMQEYMNTKEEYKDCFLFYRLGDFYELFFEDAIKCSKLLELTLTGKSCGLEERAPMCGVPFHAADTYIDKLVKMGYKVAICEQVEDPKQAKGLVKREVIRVATPGTNLNMLSLDESKNNYLMSIVYTTNAYGVAYTDITTGDFYITEFDNLSKLIDEIYKVVPSEIICNDSFLVSGIDLDMLSDQENIIISAVDSWYFDDTTCKNSILEHFHTKSLSGLGIDDYTIGCVAAGSVLLYLRETQKNSLSHIRKITPYKNNNFMLLDRATRRNLELCETMRDKEKKGSLFWVLDKTCTAMGARKLRNSIEEPILDKQILESRLDAVSWLFDSYVQREELREYLNPVYDLERLTTKISYKSANPRDLIALKQSLSMLPHIKNILSEAGLGILNEIYNDIDTLDDIYELIERAINDEPPLTMHDGDIIKSFYNENVDKYRKAATDGKKWLTDILEKEKEHTDIKNLKLKYNKVFGYYLEVTNSFKDKVPDNWIRKQTLVNAERYTTPELKEIEDTVLGARDRLYELEYELFCQVRDIIYDAIPRIQKTAKHIGYLDMLASLATVAQKNNYVRPTITTDGKIKIKGGRHPVVENMINGSLFIDNDTHLNNEERRIAIITGPNMAGKSTYMRQTALIVLMAQIGSFVPASEASICIVDRIFTRVGASDNLASGESTFMVEMTEVANILRNATKNSLIILDEIGRGTSTFDGLAIAWAVVEYIADKSIIGAKTLFATHYHELTELEGRLSGVNNYCIAVKEQGEDIIFLRKIVKGGADKSYGIQVARLAGVPEQVLKRAFNIVDELVDNDLIEKTKKLSEPKGLDKTEPVQLSLFADGFLKNENIIDRIRSLRMENMTPMDAMKVLYDLQKDIIEGDK